MDKILKLIFIYIFLMDTINLNITNLLKQKITNYELLIELRKECDILSNESNTSLDNIMFPDYETEQKLEEKKIQIKSLEYILQEIELKLSSLLLQSFTNKDNYLSGEIWNPY